MIIDISSYNGKIDFNKMRDNEQIEKIIMRASTKNGQLDTRLIENVGGALEVGYEDIEFYKFSYARNYNDAAHECTILIMQLNQKGLLTLTRNRIWLDLEPYDGREHTTNECSEIIAAYINICNLYGVRFGIYCNYSYLKNIIPKWAFICDFWVARWTHGSMGDSLGARIKYWQYDNKGSVTGITGDVDLSKEV